MRSARKYEASAVASMPLYSGVKSAAEKAHSYGKVIGPAKRAVAIGLTAASFFEGRREMYSAPFEGTGVRPEHVRPMQLGSFFTMPVAITVAGVAALEDDARLPKIAAAADTAPRRVIVWLELNAETNVGISTSNETMVHCIATEIVAGVHAAPFIHNGSAPHARLVPRVRAISRRRSSALIREYNESPRANSACRSAASEPILARPTLAMRWRGSQPAKPCEDKAWVC